MVTDLWQQIKERHQELSKQLLVSMDNAKRHAVQRECSYLSNLLEKKAEIDRLGADVAQAQEAARSNNDQELALLFQEELDLLQEKYNGALQDLDNLMFPPDPLDSRSAFIEIRAGAGGQEAALFAADLMEMYIKYAERQGWKVSVASASATELKGFREVVIHIVGKNVYGKLKHESGVHRVQRIPRTETAGRIHTSTATIAVLPEVEEVDFSINPADLRIDVYRASGAGGQHVNTTDSAVRITHIPTGVVVTCQDERSQHKNKAKALKMLQSRLIVAQREKEDAERSKQRKEQVGTGMRAEKVRTYNFPQNRVTDHQVELTLNKLDYVMLGDLDEIIDALVNKEHEDRKKRPFRLDI